MTVTLGETLADVSADPYDQHEAAVTVALADGDGNVSQETLGERVLVASAFASRRVLADAMGHGCTPSAFTSATCASFWRVFISETEAGRVPTYASITENTKRTGIDASFARAFLSNVDSNADEGKLATVHVMERWRVRQLQELGRNVYVNVGDPNTTSSALIDKIGRDLATIQGSTSAATDTKSIADEFLQRIHDNDGDDILTGIKWWDDIVGGLYSGLHFIAARSSMGKTAMMIAWAHNIGILCGLKVMVYSLEMPRWKLIARLVARDQNLRSDMLASRAKRRLYLRSEFVRQAVANGAKRVAASSLEMSDCGMSLPRLMADIRWRAASGTGVFFIDQLNRIKRPPRYPNNQLFFSDVGKALQSLSVELDVAVILLHQLNRGPDSREGNEPALNDLKDSAVEEDADTVTLLYRPEYYNRRKESATVRSYVFVDPITQCPGEPIVGDDTLGIADIAKNRDGALGRIPLRWDEKTASYWSRDHTATV